VGVRRARGRHRLARRPRHRGRPRRGHHLGGHRGGFWPAVAYVEVEPAGEVELAAGATLQLTATAFDADGNELLGRAFTWQTEDSAIATISDGGLLTAVAPGTAGVRVICESQRADLTVRVPDIIAPVPVDHITLDYTEVTLAVDRTLQVTATPRDIDGNALDRAVTWSSNNPAYVSVDGTGLVTALDIGGADITAESEGQRVSMRVWVTNTVGYSLVALGGHYIAGVYAIELQATVFPVFSAIPMPRTYASEGSVTWDAAAGQFVFQPQLGDAFTGTWTPNGVLQIRWQPEPNLTGLATFLFRE
jgi:hypothetical protein